MRVAAAEEEDLETEGDLKVQVRQFTGQLIGLPLWVLTPLRLREKSRSRQDYQIDFNRKERK